MRSGTSRRGTGLAGGKVIRGGSGIGSAAGGVVTVIAAGAGSSRRGHGVIGLFGGDGTKFGKLRVSGIGAGFDSLKSSVGTLGAGRGAGGAGGRAASARL